MARSDLQKWLLALPAFKSRFTPIVLDSVAQQFTALSNDNVFTPERADWPYLLLCASMLVDTDIERAEDAALRIAQHCLSSQECSVEQKDAAAVILDSLANRLSVRLAEQRNLLEVQFSDRLPMPLQQDYVRRALQYQIRLSTGEVISANRFQHHFWALSEQVDWLSVSAPTSAGKSYILKRWLEERIRTGGRIDVVYIVPTRALIQEVEEDLRQYFRGALLRNVVVSSVPSSATMRVGASNVFVFTQERLHLFMNRVLESFSPHVLIVDEAQKIGDGHRGVLLQEVLDIAVQRNPLIKVIFASPLTSNPEALLADAAASQRVDRLASEEITVNQNLLWVSQQPGDPKRWSVDVRIEGQAHFLGTVKLANSPSHQSKRLTFVAHALTSGQGGSIVYVNTPADAEKAAVQLWDLAGGSASVAENAEIRDLIDLVRETIHPKYVLVKTLERGVACHYGNMPLLVRKEIERLFRDGVIRYLVCTSTLLEGVNLSCRSVFARGPRKGKTLPMSPTDFWNLAGRAGRWGKEFQGNIVCVDPKPSVWRDGIPEKRVKQRVTTTAERISERADELVEFVKNGTPRDAAKESPELEYLASYLVSVRMRHGTLVQSSLGRRVGTATIQRLDAALADGLIDLEVPDEVVKRNPGISPFAMASLLEYFATSTNASADLIPAPPESDDAVESYTRVFHRINRHLSMAFGQGGRVTQCAILVRNWMRGYPLARLITSWIKYLESKGKKYTLASAIREIMEDVETVARFRAPKFMACYLDLLGHHFETHGQAELAKQLPDLSVLLEFGVSQRTQISLMSLGLSRTATIAISELIARDDLDVVQALSWLQALDLESLDLPVLTKRDIRRVVELAQPV